MTNFGERWRTSAARYASFMSYSHAADGRLAPSLQRGIERLGKPWYRRPIIRVFRDETSLSANPALWSGIQAALEQCEFFLLMCSQKAAASPWVQKEVAWWLANRPASRLLLVVTDDDIAWDTNASDFDWSTTNCLPPILAHRFAEEPYYVDLRWAKGRSDLSLSHPRFRTAVLTLAAALHGKPMEELDSEDLRQQRSLRLVALTTVALFALLAMITWNSLRNFRIASNEAASANRVADSRRMAATASGILAEHGDLHKAILIGVLAWRLSPTDEARTVLQQLAKGSADIARIIGQHSTSAVWVKGFTHARDGSPLLATLDENGYIMLWQIPSGLPAGVAFTTGHKSPNNILFSNDASTLLTTKSYSEAATPGGTIVTNLATKAAKSFPVQSLPHVFSYSHFIAGAVALSPTGRFVALLSQENQIAIWDTRTDTVSVKKFFADPFIVGFTFFDDERLLLIVGAPRDHGYRDNDLRVGPYAGLWDHSTDQLQLGHPGIVKQTVEPDDSIFFSPGGSKILVVPERSGPPLLYTHDAAMNLHVVPLPDNMITAPYAPFLVFNTSGSRLVGGSAETSIVWDLEQATVVKNVETLGVSALSEDGRWLAANTTGKISLWDLASSSQAATLKASCAFDRDDANRCIQSLCEKVTPLIRDSDELKSMMGDFEFERLRRLALSRPCVQQD